MIDRGLSTKARFLVVVGVAALALALSAPVGAQQPPADGNGSAQQPSASGNGSAAETVMNFDLNSCQQVGPGLYQCPGSDKPICDPSYDRGDVDCLRVDQNGVLIRTLP